MRELREAGAARAVAALLARRQADQFAFRAVFGEDSRRMEADRILHSSGGLVHLARTVRT